MRKIYRWSVVALSALLASCTGTTYHQAQVHINKTQQKVVQATHQANTTAPVVLVKSGYYVSTKPATFKRQPAWSRQRVNLQAHQMPLRVLMNRLLANTNINVAYEKSTHAMQPVSLHYRGPLSGALKILANQLNYAYTISGDTLTWSAYETKTFNIAFMPGSSSYLVGRSQNEGDGSVQAAGGQSSTYGNDLNDDQYSELAGEISVWEDLRHTLDQLKSPQGRVMVAESSASVTVHDHPENIAAMAHYIAKLNRMLSQEVAIKVQVLDIELNKNFNFGIDWDAIARTLGTSFALTGSLATATNLTPGSIISGEQNSGLTSFVIGQGEHTTLINALSKQGKLRVVTKPEVVTMNDQVAAIRITQNTGYIKSVSSSFVDQNVTTSITPGTITDGFTLYLLPKIEGKRVFMQISSTLSDLVRLQKRSNAPPDNSSSGNLFHNQQYEAIELPTVTEKSFNQRSVVDSGATLVIAGYKSLRDEISNASLFGIKPLGGKGAMSKNIETLVLITPIVLKNYSGT